MTISDSDKVATRPPTILISQAPATLISRISVLNHNVLNQCAELQCADYGRHRALPPSLHTTMTLVRMQVHACMYSIVPAWPVPARLLPSCWPYLRYWVHSSMCGHVSRQRLKMVLTLLMLFAASSTSAYLIQWLTCRQ